MNIYEHHAKYYETDQMGIIHHSNYFRWMEEARLDLMEQLGWGYKLMEEKGIISPVLEINCKYKHMVLFNDIICINATVKEYSGIKLTIAYEMTDKKSGKLRATGESKHCFLNKSKRPVLLKKEFPEFDQILRDLVN